MDSTGWRFFDGPKGIDLDPPDHIDSATRSLVRGAVLDWLLTDIGQSSAAVARYQSAWDDAHTRGIDSVSGNGTVQTLEAAGVVLESLYEQWDNVTISAEDFERVLKDYATFLDSRFGAAR